MEWSPIAKPRGALRREPCLADYDEARRDFAWEQAGELLDGLPGGALNIAHEAVHRHAPGPAGDRLAIRFLAQGAAAARPAPTGISPQASHRFANVLARLGVQRGERVATLMGRVPALYATVLGTLAAGAVYCPLFSAFGPGAGQGAAAARLRARAGHDRPALSPQGRADPRRTARPASTCWSCARRARATCRTARSTSTTLMRAASPDFERRAHRARGLRAAAFHQRHDGHAEGRAARARRGHRARCDGALGARPAGRRRLLVHRRSGLGHRHLVRRDRAARLRRRHDRGPRGVRRAALVRDPRHRARHGLVHGADRDPHADEGRASSSRGRAATRRCGISRASASRSIPKRSCGASRRSACRSTTPGGRPRPARS